jgi:polysaccharide pyruvyl transferase WcaK-like protein
VTDAWLANAGDGAIALATDRLLRRHAPNAAVLHAAYQWDLLAEEYAELALVPPLATLLGVEGAAVFDDWDQQAGRELVDGADLVVSQGGGFLLEHYQPWERLFALAEVTQRGLPLVLLGQTIGAFQLARARSLLRTIVRAARAVVVRDQPSFRHALDLGASPERLVLASDISLSLFSDASTAPPERDGIAVVLTMHAQSHSEDDGRDALAAAVLQEVVTRADDERVTLLSTAQGLGSLGFEDDARTAASALAALRPQQRSKIELIDGYIGPREAIDLVGRHRAVVSQRLHPALFALAQGVPAAVLLSADKLGVFAGADLGRLVCSRPSDAVERANALDAALGSGARAGRALQEALLPATRRAELNASALSEVLSGLSAHAPRDP